MATQLSVENLYNRDYYLWIETTVNLLKQKKLDWLDIENLIEEIEGMGRNQKHALKSNLVVLIMHLLKYQYQPDKRTLSWRSTIVEHRRRLLLLFQDSPSLKPYFEEFFTECYLAAREDAAIETGLNIDVFPRECPFSRGDILNPSYMPE